MVSWRNIHCTYKGRALDWKWYIVQCSTSTELTPPMLPGVLLGLRWNLRMHQIVRIARGNPDNIIFWKISTVTVDQVLTPANKNTVEVLEVGQSKRHLDLEEQIQSWKRNQFVNFVKWTNKTNIKYLPSRNIQKNVERWKYLKNTWLMGNKTVKRRTNNVECSIIK